MVLEDSEMELEFEIEVSVSIANPWSFGGFFCNGLDAQRIMVLDWKYLWMEVV